jgi:CheY-like chemotaxis protein
MSKKGPIVIVEDSADEQHLYQHALKNLNVHNKILFFDNGKSALKYLTATKEHPFLVICDIQMPEMTGIELKEKVESNKHLKLKSTPFVFRTGTVTANNVIEGYNLSAQGFFKKTSDFKQLVNQLSLIIKYWRESIEPDDLI